MAFLRLSRTLGHVAYVLLRRSPLDPKASFDLHVLGTPPAFVLSHDQTLRRKFVCVPITSRSSCPRPKPRCPRSELRVIEHELVLDLSRPIRRPFAPSWFVTFRASLFSFQRAGCTLPGARRIEAFPDLGCQGGPGSFRKNRLQKLDPIRLFSLRPVHGASF